MSIGKAHETTNQEVQECCLKPHVSDSTKTKVLCVTTVLTRKDHIASPRRDTALPGEQCFGFASLKIILKIPRIVSDSKKGENQNQQIKGNHDHLRNDLF